MNKIFIENLIFEGIHGLLSKEKNLRQRFSISVVMDINSKNFEDKIGATYDYGLAKKIVREVVEGPHIGLIEVMAERVANKILESADSNITSVTVSVRKIDIWENGVPGVSVTINR